MPARLKNTRTWVVNIRIVIQYFLNSRPFCCFRWRVVDEGICPSRCGKAIQVRKVRCMKQERSMAERPVADPYCYHLKNKPPEKITCQGKCMDTAWVYGEWEKVGNSIKFDCNGHA